MNKIITMKPKIKFSLEPVKYWAFIVLNFMPMYLYFFLHGIFTGLKKLINILQTLAAIMPSRAVTYPLFWIVKRIVEKIRVNIVFTYFIFALFLHWLTTLRQYETICQKLKSNLEYKP